MIARYWKGIAKVEEAENYLSYLKNERFPRLATIEGFRSATVMQRPLEQGIEFVVVSLWESEDAIREFAGETADSAVVPPVIQVMMVDYDPTAIHYELAEQFEPRG